MRTDKELIKIVLDNFDEHFKGLLGCTITYLLNLGDITSPEDSRIQKLIKSIPPRKKYQFWRNKAIPTSHELFWWPVDEKEPRRKYLEYLLKKVK